MSVATAEVRRRALRDQVYDRILRSLLEGEEEPGQRLSIDLVARELDVSPTPVREAMVQLERTGLVTREALKGYRVAPPLDHRGLVELFDARLMLESEATRLASARADEVRVVLRDAHDAHGEAARRLSDALRGGASPVPLIRAYFEADAAFHRALFVGAGNRHLLAMHEDLGALTHRMRQAAIRGVDDVEEAHEEHRRIVEAFESAPAEAVERMRAHILGVRGRSLAAR
ncbi:GntR family transcriptional regulator [Microbacterium sp. gxy059]|uniref:GntR family transcriptional regulator n=1 Tax=Microbacterium sp. gxy059 TaxID=2957199 RepID=UPI003D973CAE